MAHLAGLWELTELPSDTVLKHWGRICLRNFPRMCWKEAQGLKANRQPSLVSQRTDAICHLHFPGTSITAPRTPTTLSAKQRLPSFINVLIH